ncbi:MAG: DUF190 domain-containing protein [Planctomycetes bacterium]|nr:DUF190 domain-containing protein [Planctomycetota bacterium]
MPHQSVQAERLTIYLTETAFDGDRPLYEWLVEQALAMKLGGATVRKAVLGFGQHRRIHHQHVLALSDDLPVIVELIDTPDQIDAFLAHCADALAQHTYIRENVRWHKPA